MSGITRHADSFFFVVFFPTALDVLREQDSPALSLIIFFQIMVDHRGMTMRKLVFTFASCIPINREKSIFFLSSTEEEERGCLVCMCQSIQKFKVNSFN